MRLLLNVFQSIDAIRANKFRAGLTIFIIALGITALVIVMTSIEGIKTGMSNSFASLGSNTFQIVNRAKSVEFGKRGARRREIHPKITFRQAVSFQDEFEEVGIVSMSTYAAWGTTAKYRNETTNNNVVLVGTDHNYLFTSQYELEEGRTLSKEDVLLGRNVVVLGGEVKELLFPFSSPVGKSVNINNNLYKVIGTFVKQGSMGMSGGDRTCIAPISAIRNHYPRHGSISLSVYAPDVTSLDDLKSEATGIFRVVRKLEVKEKSDFEISSSDEFINQLFQQLSVITLVAQIIALITLLGAAVALLNVMLVSVTERTREIGLRKSLGATKMNIKLQFLFEAVMICQIGAILGIVLGIIGGNFVTSFMFEGSFVIPWTWVIIGLTACFVVGIASGYYPAAKAAKVDPIESLRFE
ncbi:MAG: ABC transporter permease [Bacteroidota bacterium]